MGLLSSLSNQLISVDSQIVSTNELVSGSTGQPRSIAHRAWPDATWGLKTSSRSHPQISWRYRQLDIVTISSSSTPWELTSYDWTSLQVHPSCAETLHESNIQGRGGQGESTPALAWKTPTPCQLSRPSEVSRHIVFGDKLHSAYSRSYL